MSKHTKGPLTIGRTGVIQGGPVHHFTNGSSQSQLFLAMLGLEMDVEERDANAARAVKCWNEHDALVAALEYMLNECGHLEKDHPHDYDFANERAVLEQAKAGA